MDKIFEIEPFEVFQNQLQQILTNLYYSSPTSPVLLKIEADAIDAAKQDLIATITECNFDIPTLVKVFNRKGWQPEKVECFRVIMESNKCEIFNAAFNNYNCSYGETIINFDWFVKFVLGTSELKILKYPLLQLVTSTLDKHEKHNKIIYDINKGSLRKMINMIEKNLK